MIVKDVTFKLLKAEVKEVVAKATGKVFHIPQAHILDDQFNVFQVGIDKALAEDADAFAKVVALTNADVEGDLRITPKGQFDIAFTLVAVREV